MTIRQAYEYVLIELNKSQAPSLLLEDFIYFLNKGINQYSNKIYNAYDISQQKSDDLRVLKSTAVLTPILSTDFGTSNLFSNIYEVNLPDDYVHILNCIVEYTFSKKYQCYNVNDTIQFGAKRLTADMFPQVMNNYYMRPSYKNPYFYINNVNTNNNYSTKDNQIPVFGEVDLHTYATSWGTNIYYKEGDLVKFFDSPAEMYYVCFQDHKSTGTIPTFFTYIGEQEPNGTVYVPYMYSLQSQEINKIKENRYGNHSKVRMEIRYGKEVSMLELSKIYIDYLKAPQYMSLTHEELDEVSDNSQLLEFPDYVCQEIINELVKLILENASDPRLQTNIPVSESIANPGQVQQRR